MLILARQWWLLVLRGALAVLLGLAAFLWPGVTWLVLVLIFGAYALVDGAFAVVLGLAYAKDIRRWWIFVLEGLISIIAGLIALTQPGLTALVFLYMIAAWAVVTGILEIIAAVRLRREITNEWLLALGGVLSVVVGALLAIQPETGGVAVIWLIGAYSLIFGVLLMALGFRVRGWSRQESNKSRLAPST